MKILVVEDQTKTGNYLKQGLTEAGFVVDLARTGEDGLHYALTEAYDLVVLDVMLPGIDGLAVLRGIRRAGRETPVLFLTARDEVDDRVRGLESGADDYLVKPFDLDELIARVHALQRRKLGRVQPEMRLGGLRVNPLTREVTRDGLPLSLSQREFSLLAALIEKPGAVLSREQLEARLYGWDEEVASNAIEVHLHNLRRKLGSDWVRNVRGVGYKLVDPASGPPAPAKPETR